MPIAKSTGRRLRRSKSNRKKIGLRESKEYKLGFIYGYRKAMKDSRRIEKRGEKHMKKIRETLNKLRIRNC